MVVIADDFLHPRIVVIVIGSFTPVWYNSKMVSMISQGHMMDYSHSHGDYSNWLLNSQTVQL